jgi:Zn-dependent protease
MIKFQAWPVQHRHLTDELGEMVRDPLSWSLPLPRLFGINVRMHILFPIVALGLILREAFRKDLPGGMVIPGTWIDMAMFVGLLFVAVVLHEFGHCFGGRWMDGDAQEILIWPLGGLAAVDVPHTSRANLVTAASGPFVNVALCLMAALVLILAYSCLPPLNPFSGYPWRIDAAGTICLDAWSSSNPVFLRPGEGLGDFLGVLLARFFWVNWILALVNLVLIGYPLDGGRMFQAVLWRYVGYRQATLAAIFAGFMVMFLVGLYGIIMNEVLALCLAGLVYVACRQEWNLLEMGGEEGQFGYDFSQGYTSLERDQPTAATPPPRRQSWWQRWQQRRASRRMQREQETREAEERRMDALLEKVQREGISALTDEERRFMKRVRDRYRNRQ